MRSRILTAIGVSALALAVGATFAPMASASHTGLAAAHQSGTTTRATAPAAKTCYNQADNDNGVGIVSQDFESSFDIYDANGISKFKLKKKCKLKGVHVDGAYFNGSGPCRDFGVSIDGSAFTDPGYAYTGSYDIVISPAITLAPGNHTIAVRCNMDFSVGGEWGWNTNNKARSGEDKWVNPGNGFSTGCTTPQKVTTCIAAGEGPDFSYALMGK